MVWAVQSFFVGQIWVSETEEIWKEERRVGRDGTAWMLGVASIREGNYYRNKMKSPTLPSAAASGLKKFSRYNMKKMSVSSQVSDNDVANLNFFH